jgi:hypothetical protein
VTLGNGRKKDKHFLFFHPKGIFLVSDFEPQKNPIAKERVSGCALPVKMSTDKKE